MSIRNTLVILSRKLAGYSFLSIFIYTFVAKGLDGAYGLRPEYGFFFFIATAFFFGLMTLPHTFEFSTDFFRSILLPVSLLLTALGSLLLFGRLMVFNVTSEDPIVICGLIIFALSIFLMIAAAFVGDGQAGRSPNDTSEIKEAFDGVVKNLNLHMTDKSTISRLEFDAQGETLKGRVYLNVKNDLLVSRKLFKMEKSTTRSLVSTSTLTLHPKNRVVNSAIEIETVNDAIEIKNATKEKEEVLQAFISGKNLEYFNFRLRTLSNEVFVTVDVAIEEKEAWLDFIDLMELTLS